MSEVLVKQIFEEVTIILRFPLDIRNRFFLILYKYIPLMNVSWCKYEKFLIVLSLPVGKYNFMADSNLASRCSTRSSVFLFVVDLSTISFNANKASPLSPPIEAKKFVEDIV